MFRHGEISTETDKKPFFFALGGFAGSLIAAVLLFALGGGQGLAVFAGIMLAIVALAAGAVLFAMATDRAWITDDTLTMSYLFRKREIKLSEIGRISFKDGVYSVYDRKGALAGTVNGQLTGIDRLLIVLDRSGIRFV
ncbi:MAG: complement resistance protein TraT [Oscillospiraceae bacterium]|nr:complement resistance protein TraT [Oscillospiraceae bacterium]